MFIVFRVAANWILPESLLNAEIYVNDFDNVKIRRMDIFDGVITRLMTPRSSSKTQEFSLNHKLCLFSVLNKVK